jgi:sucrose phosphorylase
MQPADIQKLISFLYGDERGLELSRQLMNLLEQFRRRSAGLPQGLHKIDERDALLITYCDMVGPTDAQGRGLEKLNHFLKRWNHGLFNFVHILPFHPYTSDDGFSVVTYREVDERYGTWKDIADAGSQHKLVFDLVINHGSASSPWFTSFLADKSPYDRWYITRDRDYDYSSVVRPRTHPLLTPFTKKDGTTVYVWTTFSADQVDYDFSNPEVLLEFITIFLEYVERGARIIRLDAIAYLWKEDGTPCIHHTKTHGVVKLLRAIVDYLELDVMLLTETNVPHKDNISYFGSGDEAHMVYNFALPPLVLHAALVHDTGPLQAWAADLSSWLESQSEMAPVFLNFLASHDGVGLTPAQGLIAEANFQKTLDLALQRGGLISYKAGKEGPVPYELNCSYVSIVAPPELGSFVERSRAFLATQAVLLAFRGLPAVYFHSWVGSEHWRQGVELLGYNRAINRQKLSLEVLETELQTQGSLRNLIYQGFKKLLEFRQNEPAMGAFSGQRIVTSDKNIFCILRGPDKTGRYVLCIQNLSPYTVSFPASSQDLAVVCKEARLGPEALQSWNSPIKGWETRWLAFGGNRIAGILAI